MILLTCILPAEYGRDPTGIGNKLGLLEMGNIKQQLAEEALADQTKALQAAKAASVVLAQPKEVVPSDTTIRSLEPVQPAANATQRSIVLAPGEAAELKLAMKQNEIVSYRWQVDQGHVNFDTHADNAKVRYHGYHKGKAVQQDSGEINAAFDGKHGWFWRNRSKQTVNISLEVSGQYNAIERVL